MTQHAPIFIVLLPLTASLLCMLFSRIKKELGELVPSYMVPRRILAVDSFPLNTNGKIDKKQLRALRAT